MADILDSTRLLIIKLTKQVYLHLLVSIEDRNELYNRLRASHVYLAENLDLTQLLYHLLSEEVITMLDVDKVRAEKGFYKQNCCLLYILQTKSPSQIETLIEGLITTNQTHLAKMIDPNGKNFNRNIKSSLNILKCLITNNKYHPQTHQQLLVYLFYFKILHIPENSGYIIMIPTDNCFLDHL